ncbi:hypothetical protein LTR53_015700 [Teratosphaeriaceae sp. CCFEE 6253]|nr:hypothetical protein LTR53_015700 [Teratosphaeriaceae sp. CCFEE 6253]
MTSQELPTTTPQPSASPSSDPAPTPGTETLNLTDPTPANPPLAALLTKRAALERTLSDLTTQRAALVSRTTLPSGLAMPDDWSDDQKAKQALTSANAVIKEHISLLHRYNEIKDIGQGLMGLIADQRGVRVAVVQEDFGLNAKD